MAFYKISPDLAKDLRAGAFLAAPPEGSPGYKVTESDDPDFPKRVWRETFVIRDVAVKVEGEQEIVQLTLVVPSDVVSANQGRTATTSLWFPWQGAEKGDKSAQTRCSINYRELVELLRAVGHEGAIGSLSDIPVAQMRNMRVNAQVKLAPDKDLVPRQNIGYFRAPKG